MTWDYTLTTSQRSHVAYDLTPREDGVPGEREGPHALHCFHQAPGQSLARTYVLLQILRLGEPIISHFFDFPHINLKQNPNEARQFPRW